MNDKNGELPEGWIEATFGDLGDWKGGGTPSKSNSAFWANGTVPWVSPKDMKRFYLDDAEDKITEDAIKNSSTQMFPVDSVLVVTRSGILERTLPVAVNRVRVATNQDVKALLPADGIDPRYVAYLLKGKDQRLREDCSKAGTTVASIDLPKLKAFKCGLAPAAEQRRIVGKIEALQERSRNAREALAEVGPLLEQFRQSLLAAAFRGDLTADWRAANPNTEPATELLARIRQERRQKWEQAEIAKYEVKGKQPPKDWQEKYKEPETYDDSELPDLPEGWCWVSLDEVASKVQDGNYGGDYPQKDEWTDTGIPFLSPAAVDTEGRIIADKVKYVSEEKNATLTKAQLEEGDLIFPNRGSRDAQRAGKQPFAILVPNEWAHGNINPQLTLVRPCSPLRSRYMVNAMNSECFLSQVRQATGGSALAFFNLATTKRMHIPLAPLAEQEAICDLVDSALRGVIEANADVAESQSDLTQLDQSILAKAFRGELVPQDLCDEPASVLLERIRSQRTVAKVQKDQKGGLKRTATKIENETSFSTGSLYLHEVLRKAGTRLNVDELQTASRLSSREFYLQLKDAITSELIKEVIDEDNRYLVPAK